MEKLCEEYLTLYFNEFIKNYQLSNEDIGKIFIKNEINILIEDKKKEEGYYYDNLGKENFCRDIKAYYNEAIYRDKYGIFDWVVDKTHATIYISNLYFYGENILLSNLLGENYSYLNKLDTISEEEKILSLLNILHIHLKRGNIGIIINNKNIQYDYRNADLILTELKDFYLKEELEYNVEIFLIQKLY